MTRAKFQISFKKQTPNKTEILSDFVVKNSTAESKRAQRFINYKLINS